MRQTPAQRHRIHTLAMQQAEQAHAASAHGETVGTAYELQLAQLHQHRLRLKDLQSVERKIEAKRALLPEYAGYGFLPPDDFDLDPGVEGSVANRISKSQDDEEWEINEDTECEGVHQLHAEKHVPCDHSNHRSIEDKASHTILCKQGC